MRKTTLFISFIAAFLIIGCNQKTEKSVKEENNQSQRRI